MRPLLRTSRFIRSAKKHIKKHPAAAEELRDALDRLSGNAFDAKLKTHKLSGELAEVGHAAPYDLRILFQFVAQDDQEAILLLTVGTHDEVC